MPDDDMTVRRTECSEQITGMPSISSYQAIEKVRKAGFGGLGESFVEVLEKTFGSPNLNSDAFMA